MSFDFVLTKLFVGMEHLDYQIVDFAHETAIGPVPETEPARKVDS